MESNCKPEPLPSADEARASLDLIHHAEADLADRLVTPWWYYPGGGLVEALLISSMTFPIWWRLPSIAVAVGGFLVLGAAWKRLTGLGRGRQYNALGRGWVIALLLILLVATAVVLLVDEPVTTAVTAVVVFGATVVVGKRGDSAIQDRLRHGARIK